MDSVVGSAKKPLNKGGTQKALSLRRTTETFRSWFGCLCAGHWWAQLQRTCRSVKILLSLHFSHSTSQRGHVYSTMRRSGACDSFVLCVLGLSSPHLYTPGTCRSEGSFSGHLTTGCQCQQTEINSFPSSPGLEQWLFPNIFFLYP